MSIALQPGALFHGRYRIDRCIKVGGMGAVYEVVDERTKSPRALKIMLPSVIEDADLRARFALEATVTGTIASDHLVRVSDAGIDETTGTPFLVMELLQGQELGNLLEERGPLPPADVVLYLHQTALALDKTHAAGIVHRDLKPENLFVTYRDDGSPCVKILDFGIAKVVEQSTARATRAVGTPMFMAPEQIRGEASIAARTDLFALGHIAFALLAGKPYWYEETRASESVFLLVNRIMAGMPEAPSDRARRRAVVLPQGFDAWMGKALAARQADRFESAIVQVAALAGVLGIPGPRARLPSRDATSSPARGSDPSPAGSVSGTLPAGHHGGAKAASFPAQTSPPQPPSPSRERGEPVGTGAAVVSAAGVPRSQPMRAFATGVVIAAALGIGGVVVLRSRAVPATVSSTGPTATVEPSRPTVSPEPPDAASTEPVGADAGAAASVSAMATASAAATVSPTHGGKGSPRPASTGSPKVGPTASSKPSTHWASPL